MHTIGSIEKFWNAVDRVYGTYLDANVGFHEVSKLLSRSQAEIGQKLGLSQQHLKDVPFSYGKGDPNKLGAIILHEIPQSKLKLRNSEFGENSIFLGAMSVVSIYQFWEDRFRREIAKEMNIPTNQLKHDLLGDIRLIRIAIIHHGSMAKKEIEKCVILKWFQEGDEIKINEERMDEIVARLHKVCSTWISQREAQHT